MIRALLLAALLAAPAHAATLIGPGPGAPLTGPADPNGPWRAPAFTLTSVDRCGSGGVVRGDGCSTIASERMPFGQAMPGGVNSQDGNRFTFSLSDRGGFDHVWINTRDAADQPNTHWVMEMEGSTARLLSRQRDGAYHGWRFKLGRVMTRISGTISTRLNDGFSMRGRVCRSRG